MTILNTNTQLATLSLDQRIDLVAHFFLFGIKVWDEYYCGFVKTLSGSFFGNFIAAEIGREFRISYTDDINAKSELVLRTLTLRSHSLALSPEPTGGTLEMDIIFPGEGALLVRERYDRETAGGGCAIYWLPKGQEQGEAKKLYELVAQTADKTMAITVAEQKFLGAFEIKGNTANCIADDNRLLIGIEFDETRLKYNFTLTQSEIDFWRRN